MNKEIEGSERKMKIDSYEWSMIILLGIVLVLIGIAIGIEIDDKKIALSQETADKICLDFFIGSEYD